VTKINESLAAKVLNVVDAGLCNGLGEPVPGQMCVMAAINYAMGEGHGDEPNCVHSYMREFDIQLNDKEWSSDAARAKGLRREAVSKLGSTRVNIGKFIRYVVTRVVFDMFPIVLKTKSEDAKRIASIIESMEKQDYDTGQFILKLMMNEGFYFFDDIPEHALRNLDECIDPDELAGWAEKLFNEYVGRKYIFDHFLTMLANIASDAMEECKSLGAKYLYLCDMTKKELREYSKSL
jgi:hypothetical protein